MLWGVVLQPGEPYTELVVDEIRLSMASLEFRSSKTTVPCPTSHVVVTTVKGEYLLCSLEKGSTPQQSLDLVLQPKEEVTFCIEGTGVVHLTGYTPESPLAQEYVEVSPEEDMIYVDEQGSDEPDLVRASQVPSAQSNVKSEESSATIEGIYPDEIPGRQNLDTCSDTSNPVIDMVKTEQPDNISSEGLYEGWILEDHHPVNQSSADINDYEGSHYVESNNIEESGPYLNISRPGTSSTIQESGYEGSTNTKESKVMLDVCKNGVTRVFDNMHCCLYCRKMISCKIKRHILMVHSEEREVKVAMAMANGQARLTAFALLRLRGDHYHNVRVLQTGRGKLLTVRRPRKGSDQRPEDYMPCPNCLGYVIKTDLFKHRHKCIVTSIQREGPSRKRPSSRLQYLAWRRRLQLSATVKRAKTSVFVDPPDQEQQPELLILANHIYRLRDHLQDEIEKNYDTLMAAPEQRTYLALQQSTAASLILYNRSRAGEAMRMKLASFTNRAEWDCKGSTRSLSSVEKELSKRLEMVQTPGRSGRTVTILLTPTVKKAIELLVTTRSLADINRDNQYIFAKSGGGSLQYLRGQEVIQSAVVNAQVGQPNLLGGTKFRSFVATVSQVSDSNDDELQWIAKHIMDGLVKVGDSFHRDLKSSVLEVAKVSKILCAMDAGKDNNFGSKTLSEINLSDIPNVEEDRELDEWEEVADEEKEEEENQQDEDEEEEVEEAGGEDEIEIDIGEEQDSACYNSDGRYPWNLDGSQEMEQSCPGTSESVSTQRGKMTKIPWTSDEKNALWLSFGHFIKASTLPGKHDIVEAMKKYTILQGRTWRNIKDAVRNIIKKENKG
ncbi:uncharacterized protein [Apostichopus japonicus]|uniref:uncharacterized protein isoform X2 n=1 Tax=Stichopus japonicus TaxID=307972 RepID=UPI003AB90C2F